MFDSLSVKYDNESARLPENIRELCSILDSDNKDCNRAYLIDPSIFRLDIDKEFSIKTVLEAGGSKRLSSPKVVGKLIQKNFDQLDVPKIFIKKSSVTLDNSLIANFIKSKSSKDSILVLS
ncbi:hypothetical protein LC612_43940, partial [Nostoc sp. CHAB 5834]|nr:hypothetical protein [Nostoc sp. CHAB 5834]